MCTLVSCLLPRPHSWPPLAGVPSRPTPLTGAPQIDGCRAFRPPTVGLPPRGASPSPRRDGEAAGCPEHSERDSGGHGALSRAFVVERAPSLGATGGGSFRCAPRRLGTSGARTGPRAAGGGAERSRAEPDWRRRRRRRSRARTDRALGRRRSRAARGGAASGPAMADEGPRKGSVSALMGRTNGLTKPAALAGGPAKPGGAGGSRKLVIKNFRGGCAPVRSERTGQPAGRALGQGLPGLPGRPCPRAPARLVRPRTVPPRRCSPPRPCSATSPRPSWPRSRSSWLARPGPASVPRPGASSRGR